MKLSTWNGNRAVLLALGLAALQLSGCASPAEITNMSAPATPGLQAPISSPYYNNISVADVAGGSETNPLWTSQVSSEDFKTALKNTLKASSLLGADDAQYQLTANVIELNQPVFGANYTVTMAVDYCLKDTKSGNVIFAERINSSYRATMGESFVGVTRLRLANEGAVRNNFDLLLKKILTK